MAGYDSRYKKGVLVFKSIKKILLLIGFFINLSGFCLIIFGITISLAIGSGFKGIKSSFKIALNNNITFTKTSLLKAIYFFKTFYKLAIEWGILGIFIKLMINVYVIDNKADIIPELGIALIPVAYALIICFAFCIPLITRLKMKLASI